VDNSQILPATPFDSIFWQIRRVSGRPNPNESKILEIQKKKICEILCGLVSGQRPSRVLLRPQWFIFNNSMKTIDRSRLQSLMQREQKKFVDERPKSKALFERARKSLLAGVPMNWMVKWAGAFPPFVREAQGGRSSSMWTGIATSTFAWATRAR
jgi:hypothetical protein